MINKNFYCEENFLYWKLKGEGYSKEEAVSRVFEAFPLLKGHKPAKRNVDDVPTMNKFNRYTVDI